MIHAGANAGIYPLKEMAFESMEGFLRAGELLSIPFLLACPLLTHTHTDLLVIDLPSGVTLVLTYFTPDFLTWLDEER